MLPGTMTEHAGVSAINNKVIWPQWVIAPVDLSLSAAAMQAERAWLQAGVSAAGGSDGDGHSGSRHGSRCSAVELAQGQTGSEEPQGCQAAPAGQAAGRHRLPGGPGARCCKHHLCVKHMEIPLRQTPQLPGALLNVVWRSLVASMPVVHCLLRLLELGLAPARSRSHALYISEDQVAPFRWMWG